MSDLQKRPTIGLSYPSWKFYDFEVQEKSPRTKVSGSFNIGADVIKPRSVCASVKNSDEFNNYMQNIFIHL